MGQGKYSNAVHTTSSPPPSRTCDGAKRKDAKLMQLDGTSFSVKPPATVGDVLRDHPGFQLLEDEEAKLLGARARSATAGDVLRNQLGFQLLEAKEVNLLGARPTRLRRGRL
jgi:hypothetical protein